MRLLSIPVCAIYLSNAIVSVLLWPLIKEEVIDKIISESLL
jgi:hypothetical protein